MPALLRVVLAVVLGALAGAVVNSGLIAVSAQLVPPPAGADMTTPEGITAALPLLEPRHFLMPFLAHALGTLVGAFVAALTTSRHRERAAYVVGVLFLAGGIAASVMIPAPAWFIAADLVLAYIPMAWLGLRLAKQVRA